MDSDTNTPVTLEVEAIISEVSILEPQKRTHNQKTKNVTLNVHVFDVKTVDRVTIKE